jgi:hypothetical protein
VVECTERLFQLCKGGPGAAVGRKGLELLLVYRAHSVDVAKLQLQLDVAATSARGKGGIRGGEGVGSREKEGQRERRGREGEERDRHQIAHPIDRSARFQQRHFCAQEHYTSHKNIPHHTRPQRPCAAHLQQLRASGFGFPIDRQRLPLEELLLGRHPNPSTKHLTSTCRV